jgi:hypothetical protein
MLRIINKFAIWVLKQNMNINYKNTRLGFKVPIGFTPLSNAWLWVPQKPYPKSASVRWISNLISNFPIFYT